jgi:hypothetical protein
MCSYSESNVIDRLAARAGQVVTRDEILDALWGVDYVSESNVIDRLFATCARSSKTTGVSPGLSPPCRGGGIGSCR